MGFSETFGVEKGSGTRVVEWLNSEALAKKYKIEFRLYGYKIDTENFGSFEMISWMGDVQSARKLITKASKRFKIKAIEGGYKPSEKNVSLEKIRIRHDQVRCNSYKWKIRTEGAQIDARYVEV